MKNKGIGEYWTAQVIPDDDIHCGHAHHSFDAAEKCAQRTIRAAKRAVAGKREKFYNYDEIAHLSVSDAAHMVKHHTYGK